MTYNFSVMSELKIGPPPFPNREKYPFVGTTRFRNMTIDIENLDGSVRSGVGPDGKPWKTEFSGALYGEIRHSKGTDGDPVDVYLKNPPDDEANLAYIIHQNHPRNDPDKPGEYDEDKVVLGVSSPDEAKELYLKHYNRKDFFRSLTMMGIEPFKRTIFSDSKGEKIAMIKIATLQDAYDLGVKIAFHMLGLKLAADAPAAARAAAPAAARAAAPAAAPQAGIFETREGWGDIATPGSPSVTPIQMVAGKGSLVERPGGGGTMPRPAEKFVYRPAPRAPMTRERSGQVVAQKTQEPALQPGRGATAQAPVGRPTQPATTQIAATAAPRPAPAI